MEPTVNFALITLAALVVGSIAVLIAVSRRRVAEKAWEEAARKLGLTFSKKGFRKLRLRGELEGQTVEVHTFTKSSGNSSRRYTRFEVEFSGPHFDLKLVRSGALSGVAKFFGAQDIEVGSPEFDRGVIVKSNRPRHAAQYLTPERQTAVLAFLLAHPGSTITNEKVTWTRRGLVRTAEELETALGRLCDLAKVMEASRRRESRERVRKDEPAKKEPVAPVLPAGRDADGAPIFELQPVAEPVEAAPEPAVAEAQADPGDAEGASPAPDATTPAPAAPAPSPEPPPEAAEACDELFAGSPLGTEVTRLFEEHYSGARVEWRGKLERLDAYYSDFVFQDGPGTRATLELAELEGPYGKHRCELVLQLGKEAAEELRDRVGETVRFRGRLVRCEPYMRRLLCADGEIL